MDPQLYIAVSKYESLARKVLGEQLDIQYFNLRNAYRDLAYTMEGRAMNSKEDKPFMYLKNSLIRLLRKLSVRCTQPDKPKLVDMIKTVADTVTLEGVDKIIKLALELNS